MLKWVIGIVGLIVLAVVVSGWWATKDLQPMDEAARSLADGAFVTVTDGQLHYRVAGPEDGPVIVMVHGFSTPNFIFEQNVEALAAAGFRVLRFDHFGRGWSDRPNANYDVEFYDRELIEFLDAMNLTAPVGLVGLSMGGPITAEFTARHPERVRKLFLFVPAGFDISGADSGAVKLLRVPVLGDWLWNLVGKGTLLGDAQYDESARAPENRLKGDVTQQMEYKGYLPALLSSLRHMPMAGRAETFARVRELGVPVMAVFGDADATVLVSSAAKLQAQIPGADVRVLAGAGHGLNYQRHEDVNPMLIEWFAEAAVD